MSHPARLQRTRSNREIPPNAVYVGRGSAWASPFLSNRFGHARAVGLHRAWLDGRQQQLRDQLAAMRWWHAHYPARSTYALTMTLMLRHDALLATENDTERKAA